MSKRLTLNASKDNVVNTYIYAADGWKLTVNNGSLKTDYVGNVIYENGIFKRLLVDGEIHFSTKGKESVNDLFKVFLFAANNLNVRNDVRNNGRQTTLSYVYMPNSSRLYHISNSGPAYIRHINNSHKRFFFGTLK